MAERATSVPATMLRDRGLPLATPASIDASVRAVLETMPTALYGRGGEDLTAEERQVLADGGIDLSRPPGTDPFAAPVATFAALLATSLDTAGVAERLGVLPGQVRQMIARRTLYSVLHGGRRYLFAYQFGVNGGLVPNIGRINAALDPELHPLEVHGWFTEPNPDLFLGDDIDRTVSPIQWLESGGGVAPLLRLAKHYY